MKKGDVVYFYYDEIIPAQKGIINELFPEQNYAKIQWLSDISGNPCGTSGVLMERIFATKEECFAYAKAINSNTEEKLYQELDTSAKLFNYLLSCIRDGEGECIAQPEQNAARRRIFEFFGKNALDIPF